MSLTSSEEALLLAALPTIEKTRYAELASTVIILFDHLITLDQEINLIWRAHWGLGKVLFLINRYYALVIVIFNNYALFNSNQLTDSLYVVSRATGSHLTTFFTSCLSWFRWQGWTGVLTFIVAELILQLRLYALYFRDKRVLVCMSFVCAGTAATSAYVMGAALSSITSTAVWLPHKHSTVCIPSNVPAHFYAFWIPMLVSESVLCGLALVRGFRAYTPGSNVFQNGKRIIEILVRDSLFYFVIIFATYLVNTVLFITQSDSEVEIPIGFAVALSVVLSNRLCLNVRGYIRPADDSLPGSLPARAPALVDLSRSGYTSHTHGGYEDDGDDRDGDGEDDGYGVAPTTFSVVHGGVLSDLEMHELRAMRAQSPKHVRTFS